MTDPSCLTESGWKKSGQCMTFTRAPPANLHGDVVGEGDRKREGMSSKLGQRGQISVDVTRIDREMDKVW